MFNLHLPFPVWLVEQSLPRSVNPGLAGGGSPCLQVGDLVIDKYWPNQIDLNSSDTIRVLLIRRDAGTFSIATSTTASHQAAEETPTAYFGLNLTPLPNCGGTDLPSAFGTTNELFAAAHLVATTFTVQSTGPEEQSLNPANGTEWDWNISPKTLGTQLINVDIDLLWKSRQNGQVVEQVQIWRSQFIIKVVQPFFDSSQLTASALATFL